MEEIRIIIADDHQLVRQGLRSFIELQEGIEIVAEATDGLEAIELSRDLSPDVLLLDLRMPGADGVSVCREVKETNPDVKVIILTTFDDAAEIEEALEAGASSYILKDVSPDRLVKVINSVVRGQRTFHPAVAAKIADRLLARRQPSFPALSSREIEILGLLAKGYKNKEIARTLWISESTVKTHVSHILQKLDQEDRTKAILFAMQQGLIKI
jgi:NarL family two-component system response regulator LiaR